MKATGWKEHSCRAFLTGVRKANKLHDAAIAVGDDVAARTRASELIPKLDRMTLPGLKRMLGVDDGGPLLTHSRTRERVR